MRTKLTLSASLGLGLLLTSVASAGSVGLRNYNTVVASADRVGKLESSDGGLAVTGTWVSEGFRVGWNITPATGGFLYSYSLSGLSPATLVPAISHFILELSPNVAASAIVSPTLNGSALTNSMTVGTLAPNPGSPGLPMTVYGLKVDKGGSTVNFSFVMNRVPVWGNFYAKGGGGPQLGQAYNAGFTTTNNASGYFIARPDSVPSTVVLVPLPPAVLGGLVLLGLAGVKMRARL